MSMEYRWNDADSRKPNCLENNGTLPTTNPSWTGLGLKTCLRGERQATDHLSHDTALKFLTATGISTLECPHRSLFTVQATLSSKHFNVMG